jgi:dUTPase
MRTLKITKKHRKAVTFGSNPFSVVSPVSIVCFNRRVTVFSTGIGMDLPDDLALSFKSAIPDLATMGHVFVKGELILLLSAIGQKDYVIEAGDRVAIATIIKREVVPARFVEFTAQGGRMIKGDPRPIEHRDTTSDPES